MRRYFALAEGVHFGSSRTRQSSAAQPGASSGADGSTPSNVGNIKRGSAAAVRVPDGVEQVQVGCFQDRGAVAQEPPFRDGRCGRLNDGAVRDQQIPV